MNHIRALVPLSDRLFAREGLLRATQTRCYVRDLSWCSPGPRRKKWADPAKLPGECGSCAESVGPIPDIPPHPKRFGVVAAMSRNRVIGVGGSLPWSIPEDRRYFESLTRDRVLILGRQTWNEREDGSHVSHVRRCILVSRTAAASDYPRDVIIARSFPDALGVAKGLADSDLGEGKGADGDIDCWVGGGERIYEEAMQHPGAWRLHLTKVHMDIDVASLRKESSGKPMKVALFPAKYRWDRKFKEIQQRDGDETSANSPQGVKYSFLVYERKDGW